MPKQSYLWHHERKPIHVFGLLLVPEASSDCTCSFPNAYSGGRFAKRNSTYTNIAGTKNPWLLTSAAHGLRKLVIPLLGKGDPPASYRLRLALAAPPKDKPGQRVFNVTLQNKLVEKGFDIVRAAGGVDRAVFREFRGIEVRDNLTIELVAKLSQPAEDQWPILQAIEIVREDVVPKPDRFD